MASNREQDRFRKWFEPGIAVLQRGVEKARSIRFSGQPQRTVNMLTDLIAETSGVAADEYLERGVALRELGNITAAEQDFVSALNSAEKSQDEGQKISALTGLMDVYRVTKKLDKAVDCALQARLLVESQSSKENIPTISYFTNTALISIALNNWDIAKTQIRTAESLYGAAHQRLRSPQGQDAVARLFHVAGRIEEYFDNLSAAQDYQSAAYVLYEKLGGARGMGNAAFSSGEIAVKRGRNREAQEWFEKALAAYGLCEPNDSGILLETIQEVHKKIDELGNLPQS